MTIHESFIAHVILSIPQYTAQVAIRASLCIPDLMMTKLRGVSSSLYYLHVNWLGIQIRYNSVVSLIMRSKMTPNAID